MVGIKLPSPLLAFSLMALLREIRVRTKNSMVLPKYDQSACELMTSIRVERSEKGRCSLCEMLSPSLLIVIRFSLVPVPDMVS